MRQILETLGGRSYGGLFLILSPMSIVPGIGYIAAVLLIFLSLQMAFGRGHPYCPERLATYPFRARAMRAIFRWIIPYVVFGEKFVRLRHDKLTRRPFDLLIGFVVSLLAVITILPLPLLDLMSMAAVFVMALAVLERDGIALLMGLAAAVVTFLTADLVFLFGIEFLHLVWR